jgi:hypothetical protein
MRAAKGKRHSISQQHSGTRRKSLVIETKSLRCLNEDDLARIRRRTRISGTPTMVSRPGSVVMTVNGAIP